jgi:beta-phosphoglucomutase-like phosphatase (HAD superfamily)
MMSKDSSSRRPGIRGRRRGVIATVLAALALAPALASAIVVPDQAPTIQAGIDSGADTVQVRPGYYPETIMVDRPWFSWASVHRAQTKSLRRWG